MGNDKKNSGDDRTGTCLVPGPQSLVPAITLNRPPRGVRVERTVMPGADSDVPAVTAETVQKLLDDCRRQAQAEVQAERAQLGSAAAALRAACEELRRQQADLRAEAEHQLLELAIEIARKVLMQEIQAGRYEIEPIIRAALARAGPAGGEVVVHLNADDLARCKLAGAQESAGLRLVADGAVQGGECVVHTGEGVVESRIESHVQEIERALEIRE